MTAAAGLAGKVIVVPVTAQHRELADRLLALGADVFEAECIRIEPPSDPAPLRQAVEAWGAGEYDWLAVTSRNAVSFLASGAAHAGVELSSVGTPVAAVGEATRKACSRIGLRIELVPQREDALGLAEAFPEGAGRVLAPLGNLAAAGLAEGLRAKGWTVDEVEAYRTVDGPGLTADAREALATGTADALVLTSASVARSVRRSLGETSVHPSVAIVAIGPTTAAGAAQARLDPTGMAARPSHDGILEALAAALKEPT